MTIEDYKRGIRAMNDIRVSAPAALIAIETKQGELKLTTLGEPEDIQRLVLKIGEAIDERRGK